MRQRFGERVPRVSAREAAMGVLSRGMCTERRLREKLTRAGHAAGDVDAAVGEMKRLGYVDDARFAAVKARREADRRKRGERGTDGVLIRAGVEKGLARRASREAYAEVDTAGAARALVEQKVSSMAGLDRETARRRLSAMLVRRGFSAADIRAAVGPAVARLPQPEPRRTGWRRS